MSDIRPNSFPGDKLKQILSILHNQNELDSYKWHPAIEIQKRLLDEFGIHIHYKTIDVILENENNFVNKKRIKKQWAYKLLNLGKEILIPSQSITVIDPSNPVTSISSLHDYFSKLQGQVLICDPYLNKDSLPFLDSIPISSPTKFLTQKFIPSGRFTSIVQGLLKKGLKVEFRKINQKLLHDRYIIDDSKIIFLGTSLNGIGKTQSFIFIMKYDIRDATENIFLQNWSKSMQI